MKHFARARGVFLAAVLTVSAALLMTACSDKQAVNGTDQPVEQQVESTRPETRPPVEVAMPEYTFSYSGELSDYIIMKELPEDDLRDLEFQVKLSSGEYTIFTLIFNSLEGDLVTMLPTAKGDKVPVAFEMTPVPKGLTEEDTRLYCRAQESVNEIVESLKLK